MPKIFLPYFPLLAFWFFLLTGVGSALQIEGVVLSEKGPVPDAVVTAYPDYASLSAQQNGTTSTPGEKPGQYRITVPPGTYYLVAAGSERGTPLAGYHGLNPLRLDGEYHWIPLIALPRKMARCEPGPSGVGGRVLYKGSPAAGSSVSVYTPSDEPFRGVGLLTNTVTEEGRFRFDLAPGTYVVIARKRATGGAIGPIRKGDLFCAFSGNPILIPADRSCMIDISCYPRDDLNAFLAVDATDPRGRKEPGRRAASLKETDETGSVRLLGGESTMPAFVSGRVTDLTGMPLGDLFIAAYPADEVPLFQMYALRMKTEHLTRSDAQGFYRLEVGSGSYYLVARERIGDAPVAGEYYGIYEGSPNHSINLRPNEIKSGVHLTAEPIMP